MSLILFKLRKLVGTEPRRWDKWNIIKCNSSCDRQKSLKGSLNVLASKWLKCDLKACAKLKGSLRVLSPRWSFIMWRWNCNINFDTLLSWTPSSLWGTILHCKDVLHRIVIEIHLQMCYWFQTKKEMFHFTWSIRDGSFMYSWFS